MITIFHNAKCGKSRECLAYLHQSGAAIEIVNYLVSPPSYVELEAIIKKLNIKPLELVRQKESVWISNFKNKSLDDQQIIEAMVSHPILIQRPIVVNGDQAVIVRPVEKIKEIV